MYPDWLNKVIVCPETKKPLKLTGNCFQVDDKKYFIKDDILSAVFPEELIGDDAKFNRLYNIFAPFYDLNERVLGKLLTGVNMVEGRRKIISFLELKQGMRVLEVSPGPGVFQKFIRSEIGNDGELVALDLSMGMLSQCQKKNKKLNVHLVHGNGQYLPFADNSFDALFHFGGVNLFNDSQKAIEEFIRVVKKDGIVSWGDEGFSIDFSRERIKKIMIKMNPGFLKPHPTIPGSVYDVKENEAYEGLAYLVVAKKQ